MSQHGLIRRSLAGRLLFWLLPLFAAAIALPLVLVQWLDDPWLVGVLSAVVIVPLAAWLVHRALVPLNSLFRALSGSVSTYRDGEYNFSIHWNARDDLGDLVRAHAELGEVLREQRQGLVQRELLLDTMVQNTPVAMLLVAAGGDGVVRVVFANLAARKLLHGGWKLEGQRLDDLLAGTPVEMRQAMERGGDGLFAIGSDDVDDEEQVYHLARRHFRLNGRKHELLLLRLLTNELRRQEVQTWKKVIRVISHELNNSLAPISSLAHSGTELARRGDSARLPQVFAGIGERARHLHDFIAGYADFARLPAPRCAVVAWAPFVEGLRQHAQFQFDGDLPKESGWFDAAQVEQVLINLLKNAHESGSAADAIRVRVTVGADQRIEVLDRGPGMNDTVLAQALLPFYSTKRSGTGLGLALAREISEAHGGRITLANRDGGGLRVVLQLPRR